MPEVPHAGEHHGDAMLVGGGDDFVVAHGTARLDYRRDAGGGGVVEAVAEREEGVAGHHRAGHHETGLFVMQVLRDMARAVRCTLIVVTHDTRIFAFADRVARMDDGRIVGVEPIHAATVTGGPPCH